MKGARIGVLREISETEIDAEILVLFENAIADMQSMGAVIIDSVKIPDFASLRKNQWCDNFKSDIEKYLTTYEKNDTRMLEELLSAKLSKSIWINYNWTRLFTQHGM